MENKKNIKELKVRLLKESTKRGAIKKEIARIAIKNKVEGKNK